MNHGAKHHFVPAAHGTAEPAGHPGFHERRNALVKPPRGIMPWAGERAVKDGDRILVGGRNFSEEQRAKAAIGGIGIVAHHDVDGLMIHDPGHAFVGWQGLVGVAEGRDTDVDEVGRDGAGRAMSVIPKIFEQYA